MSHAMPEHEAALRRALHAAAAEIDPRDDGLERIQRRLRQPRPLPIAWAQAVWVKLSLRVPDAAWMVADRLAAEARAVSRHFMPPSAARGRAQGSRSWMEWLRPLAAMGLAVSIVTAVVYMAIEVPQAIVSTTGNTGRVTNGQGPTSGSGNGRGASGVQGSSGASLSPGASGSPSSQACGSGKRTKIPVLTPGPSSSATSSPTATPSPTPSTSAPSSPSPTPTGTSTDSPSPATSTTPPSDSVETPDPTTTPSTDNASEGATLKQQTARQPSLVSSAESSASSPCPSTKPSKKASIHKVTPDVGSQAAAGPLVLAATETAAVWVLTAADVKTWVC